MLRLRKRRKDNFTRRSSGEPSFADIPADGSGQSFEDKKLQEKFAKFIGALSIQGKQRYERMT